MKDVVIVSGVRTPVGSFGGSLKSVSVVELGATVMKSVLKRVGLRPEADEAVKAFGPETLKDQGQIDIEKKGMTMMTPSLRCTLMRSSWAMYSRQARGRIRPARP